MIPHKPRQALEVMLAMFCLAQKTKVLAGQKSEFVERHILGLRPKISDSVRGLSKTKNPLNGNYLAVSEHVMLRNQSVPYNKRNLLGFPKFVLDDKIMFKIVVCAKLHNIHSGNHPL